MAGAVALGLGAAYDLRLSRTAWSWLPLALALPVVPIHAWLGATGSVPPGLLALVPAGLGAGAALALANGLVDLERDARTDRRGAVVALGPGRAWLAHAVLLGVVAGFAVLVAPAVPAGGEASAGSPSPIPLEVLQGLRTWAVVAGVAALGLGAVALRAARPGIRERGWELEAVGVAGIGLGGSRERRRRSPEPDRRAAFATCRWWARTGPRYGPERATNRSPGRSLWSMTFSSTTRGAQALMHALIGHARHLLLALTVLALSAGLAFGSHPTRRRAWPHQRCRPRRQDRSRRRWRRDPQRGRGRGRGRGRRTPTRTKETDEDEGWRRRRRGRRRGREQGPRRKAPAASTAPTDPSALTEEDLALMNHGSLACWAAHQAEWPEWFSNHGAFVRCWAHHGKADATSCTVDPNAETETEVDPAAATTTKTAMARAMARVRARPRERRSTAPSPSAARHLPSESKSLAGPAGLFVMP